MKIENVPYSALHPPHHHPCFLLLALLLWSCLGRALLLEGLGTGMKGNKGNILEGEKLGFVHAALIAFIRFLTFKKVIWVHAHGDEEMMLWVFCVFWVFFSFYYTSSFCSQLPALCFENTSFKFLFMCSAEMGKWKIKRNIQSLVIFFLLVGQDKTHSWNSLFALEFTGQCLCFSHLKSNSLLLWCWKSLIIRQN